MRKRDRDRYRKMLDERRRQLLESAARAATEGRDTKIEGGEDYVDDAVTNYNRELLLSRSSQEKRQLDLVEEALERIEDGTYGDCEMCEEPIGPARLKAVPWARYCIKCQEKVESDGIGDVAQGVSAERRPR